MLGHPTCATLPITFPLVQPWICREAPRQRSTFLQDLNATLRRATASVSLILRRRDLLRGFRGVPKYTAGRSGPRGPAHVVKTAVCWFGEMFFIFKLLCCTSSAEFSENGLGFFFLLFFWLYFLEQEAVAEPSRSLGCVRG